MISKSVVKSLFSLTKPSVVFVNQASASFAKKTTKKDKKKKADGNYVTADETMDEAEPVVVAEA